MSFYQNKAQRKFEKNIKHIHICYNELLDIILGSNQSRMKSNKDQN